MIKIKPAKEQEAQLLALLATVTYAESHGHFIEDQEDLKNYLQSAFSVATVTQELADEQNLFYIIYVDELPVGYAKLVLNAFHENASVKTSCRLERIYVLADYIPLKLGQQLLDYMEEEAKKLALEEMWLSVYVKNKRAIRFYEKNNFHIVGELMFSVNGKDYDNHVLSKKL